MYEPHSNSGFVSIFFGIIAIVVIGSMLSMIGSGGRDGDGELQESLEEHRRAVSRLKVQLAQIRGEIKVRERNSSKNLEGIESMERQWEIVEGRVGRALSEKTNLIEEIENLKHDHELYAGKAREEARKRSIGRRLGDLSTRTGRVFQSAVVRSITDESIIITHDGGVTTLMAAELPAHLQQRFHLGQNGERLKHGVLDLVVDRPSSPPVATPVQGDKHAVARAALQEASARYYALVRQCGDIERMSRASRSKSVPGSLETWDSRLLRIRNELANARIEYHRARSDLGLVMPADPMLIRPHY